MDATVGAWVDPPWKGFTGGLSRAYAGVVARGPEALPTLERARLIEVTVEVTFAAADALFRILEELRAGVATFTSGRGRVVESA